MSMLKNSGNKNGGTMKKK